MKVALSISKSEVWDEYLDGGEIATETETRFGLFPNHLLFV